MQKEDHYSVLGVPSTSEQAALQKAYRALMRRSHPDGGMTPDVSRAQQINEAYQVLSDPDERARYDALRQDKPAAKPHKNPRPSPTTRKVRSKPPVRKQSTSYKQPRISETGTLWWVVAFLLTLFALLFFTR